MTNEVDHFNAASEDTEKSDKEIYACEKYGFRIKCPNGYRVIEAKPREEVALVEPNYEDPSMFGIGEVTVVR